MTTPPTVEDVKALLAKAEQLDDLYWQKAARKTTAREQAKEHGNLNSLYWRDYEVATEIANTISAERDDAWDAFYDASAAYFRSLK